MKSDSCLIFVILCMFVQCCASKPTSNDVVLPDILVDFNSEDSKVLDVLELSYDNMKHSATLVCLTQGYKNSSVNWYLNGDLQKGVYETSQYAGSNTLKLTGLSENDDGKEYTCKEEREGGSIQKVRLVYNKVAAAVTSDEELAYEVEDPKNVVSPDIVVQFNSEDPKVLDVLELSYDNMKHSATLVCLIQGNAKSSIKWYLNEDLQDGNNTLQLTGLSENDDGKEYTCREERYGGSVQSVRLVYKNGKVATTVHSDDSLDYEVEDPKIELPMNLPPTDNINAIEVSILLNDKETSSNELIISGPATLNCLAQGRNPPILGWFEDNTQYVSSKNKSIYSSSSILEIPNLPITEEGRTFACRPHFKKEEEISVTVYSVEDMRTPSILINNKLVVNENANLDPEMEVVCIMKNSTAVSSLSLFGDNIPLQYYNVTSHFADGFLRIKTVLQNLQEGQILRCGAVSDDGVTKVWKKARLTNYRSNSIKRYALATLLVLVLVIIIFVIILAAGYLLNNKKRQLTQNKHAVIRAAALLQ